jgi:hypothetical protein
MGIYSDIQSAMSESFSGDLFDAVTNFKIYYRGTGDGVYNASSGEYEPDANHYLPTMIGNFDFTDGSCRGILQDLDVKDTEDGIKYNYKINQMLVLDSEIKSFVFDFDLTKYFLTIGVLDSKKVTYEIVNDVKDSAGATHKLELKEVQS